MENGVPVSLWEILKPPPASGHRVGFSPSKMLLPLEQGWGQQILSYFRGEGSRATMQNTQIFHFSGPDRWETGLCQQSKEGNPNTSGAAFHGAPARFEILAPEGFKIFLPEAED